DVQREDRHPLERTAREHVEHLQDRARLILEQLLHRDRVDARQRDERADAVDDQRPDQEQQALAQIREAGRVGKKARRSHCAWFCHDPTFLSRRALRLLVYSTLPPAASMIAFAPGVTGTPTTLTGRSSVPDAMIFTRSTRRPTSPAAFSDSSVTSPSTFASSCTRTSSRVAAFCDRKPTFGSRRCNGIWPPSKPTL